MTTLLLELSGPLQAWGTASRFARRTTDPQPSKSGVIGLLAAALGRRRTDPIEDLLGLSFAVRLDQPGTVLRDFQTAIALDGSRSMPLSERHYLEDARFVAGVEGEGEILEALAEGIRNPAFPLYLGRRSCTPAGPLVPAISSHPLREAIAEYRWIAARRVKERSPRAARLEVVADALEGDEVRYLVRDVPLSFSPELRSYGYRSVTRYEIEITNVDSTVLSEVDTSGGVSGHDPMAFGGE